MKQKLLFLMLALMLSITKSAASVVDGINYETWAVDRREVVVVALPLPGRWYTGSIVIPETVVIGGITFPVVGISTQAFVGCSGLKEVIIPNTVRNIGVQAFLGCSSLEKVTIPNSVTHIGNKAFRGCSSLKEVTISNSLTTIEDEVFDGCTSLKEVIIPNSVTSIGVQAFFDCSSLEKVTIPNSVTTIEKLAFQYCSGLTAVTIPNSVTSIGFGAFLRCSGLLTLTIPNSVTSIGNEAFNYCTALKDIYNYAIQPQAIKEKVFSNYNATLHVSAGCKAAYEAADVWKNFTIVEDINVTGVKSVFEDLKADGPIYDLQGCRVEQMESGKIYVRRGRKFRQP